MTNIDLHLDSTDGALHRIGNRLAEKRDHAHDISDALCASLTNKANANHADNILDMATTARRIEREYEAARNEVESLWWMLNDPERPFPLATHPRVQTDGHKLLLNAVNHVAWRAFRACNADARQANIDAMTYLLAVLKCWNGLAPDYAMADAMGLAYNDPNRH